ncbi:HEXXH motif domain-containing protein [Nonomuraea sp. NBC_00507]|uniref:HEXXH motif domain-containing protein n=1 Tax=Nonomuraea sp. NBC_00507 TaxID=2976002 RepID=UPI002E1797FA
MRPRDHRIPDDALQRLAAGGGGAAAVRHLVAAEQSKHRLLMILMMRLSADLRHPHAAAAEHAYELLAEAEKKQPGAVRGVIGHPAVGAWLKETVQALQRGEPGRPGPAQLGAVAAVAAVRAGLPCRAEVPAPDGTIMLPALGQIVLGTGADGAGLVDLRVHAGGQVTAGGVHLRPDEPERPGWRPLRQVTTAQGDLTLLVDDLDPFRWPRETVIEGRLPDGELNAWRAGLESAWAMLRQHHWTIAEETREIVSVLTPIQGPDQGMNSASQGARFGAVAMSTPPDGRWLASTFAHEVQHAKLGAILDVVRLLEPGKGTYYAPWRPDPRPLSGLIQGAYAYLGVSGFWRRQRAFEPDLRPHIEFAHWRESAHAVTGTLLDSGQLTATGERFVTSMRRTLSAWLAEPVPDEALRAARQEAEAHRAAWGAGNEPVTG